MLGSRGDDVLRRVPGPNLRLGRDPVPREPCGHRRGVPLMALAQFLAVGLERQAAQRVQPHHQLKGGRVDGCDAEGGRRQPFECPPVSQHVGNELRARRSVGCHQQTRSARPPGDQDRAAGPLDDLGRHRAEQHRRDRTMAPGAEHDEISGQVGGCLDNRARCAAADDASIDGPVAAAQGRGQLDQVASASRRTASAASASRAPPAASGSPNQATGMSYAVSIVTEDPPGIDSDATRSRAWIDDGEPSIARKIRTVALHGSNWYR